MDNLRHLNRRLVSASSAADGAYYRWARRSGVTLHTLDLLYALDDGTPRSQKQICEEWGLPKTTVNTVVKACQEAGYLTLEVMPGQPRERRICLTAAGMAYAREVLEDLYAAENAAMGETIERFGPAFVDAAAFFFARFQAAIDASLSEKPEKEDTAPV